MIFIVVKFTVRPDRSKDWLDLVADFTAGTRSEAGNVFFEWSRSEDDPHQFVLVEGFASAAAGQVHVSTEHFAAAMAWMPDVLAQTPDIINVEVAQDGWGKMAELQPSQS